MSGYHLYRTSNLESVLETNTDIFLQKHPLSEPVFLVVQNAGLGEWLIRRLASLRGGVMGVRILMPEMALRLFAAGYPSARAIQEKRGLLFMDGMKLTVYKALEEAINGNEDAFEPLRSYVLDAAGADGSGSERLWQLADAVAGIFYHYGMNCLPLVEAWERNEEYKVPNTGLPDFNRAAEAWQWKLWRRIFHNDAPYTHLSRVLSELMSSGEHYDGERARIVLFGSTFLGETGLRFFRYLAADLDVHHFILTPSRAYGDDSTEENLPLLRSSGTLIRGFSRLVPSLKPDSDEQIWENPGVGNSLLRRTREALINDAPLQGEMINDGSLDIHDVCGTRREVEVLKDRILAALRDDESLAPTEIGVLAPDISRYAPYIETVFPSGNSQLPYNLSDLPGREQAPYPAAFAALLNLPGSRFGKNQLMDLLENPCFAPPALGTIPAPATEQWREIADSLHVRWGVDAEHRRQNEGADKHTGSWESAFSRLLDGYCFDGDDRETDPSPVDTRGFEPELFPANPAGDSDADLSGLLMRAVRSLDADLRGLDRRSMSTREWTLLWEVIVESWLAARSEGDNVEGDESDRLRIKGAFRDLIALCDDVADLGDFTNSDLPWPAFRSLLEETVAKRGGGRGRYLARGVTCSSLKPLRAIPFRRLYILGLDEGVWPGREMLTGFDLRESVPKAIDLSRESVDRFAFLEAVFSAKEHLSLFYNGRDAERGEVRSPAIPVLELFEFLGEGYQDLVSHHPLLPWDPRALTGSGPLATSSMEALELSESRRKGLGMSGSSFEQMTIGDRLTVAEENTTGIDWNDLVRFLKNPVEHFFRRRLGVSLYDESPDIGEEDILESSFLDWWAWRNEQVTLHPDVLANPERLLDGFRCIRAREGEVADTLSGELQLEKYRSEAEEMSGQLHRLVGEGLSLDEPFLVPLTDSGTGIGGTINGFRPLTVDGQPDEKTWTILEFIAGKQVRSRHRIRSWVIALLVGSMATEKRPDELRVFRISAHNQKARRYFFYGDPDDAGGSGERVLLSTPDVNLQRLLESYHDGMSSPLPLYPELADELIREAERGSLSGRFAQVAESAWYKLLNDDFNRSSLRDCPYRSRFLLRPDFAAPELERAFENLYLNGGLA